MFRMGVGCWRFSPLTCNDVLGPKRVGPEIRAKGVWRAYVGWGIGRRSEVLIDTKTKKKG